MGSSSVEHGKLPSVRLLVVLVLLSGHAHAQADAVSRSRVYFETGMKLYQARLYDDALRSFETGYQLAARPGFLINMGHCYRALGKPRQAREMYSRFLVDAPSHDPNRKGVENLVAELDQQIAALPPVEVPPPPAPPAPAPPVVAPAPVVAAAPAPPVEKKHGIRKLWWLIPVTIVAAAGIAVGLGLGLTQRSCPSGDLCVVADGPR
jgi:hypothetical protein